MLPEDKNTFKGICEHFRKCTLKISIDFIFSTHDLFRLTKHKHCNTCYLTAILFDLQFVPESQHNFRPHITLLRAEGGQL